ncbi:diguanylate cyclase/phosphodiesterase (GGDEF & EAL domain) with PAS/PAC sensor(s) [Rhodopirellula islandica]|uniref:histidine kinase n=2 Tax=Rhodopirellula islandica TaxID=595434 RepID=A0A0J1B5M5_RHOIS|nr:diguanylate cyclase/phosphodiesterase (GGDEF & EAL domain) with PAS/PAC sensor(s) [Rhodopirellula islandica]
MFRFDCMFGLRTRIGCRDRNALALTALALAFYQFVPAIASEADDAKTRNVIVVYSYGDVLPANEIVDRVLRDRLQVSGQYRVDVYNEYLDIARFPGKENLERTRSLLKEKYADRKVDLVVAGGSEALDFLVESRDSLFADVPLISTCVGQERIASDPRLNEIPGIPIRLELMPTLDLAIGLQPKAKQLFVITGASQLDLNWQVSTAEQLRESGYDQRFEVTYLSGLPMDELIRRVQVLPRDAIVLFLLCMQDGEGEHFFSPDVVEQLSAVSPSPLYGIYNTYHGRGIVGGHFATFEGLANSTAKLALQILDGNQEAVPDVSQTPALNHLDWRQLRHWGLNQSRVPEGSVVAFRELTAWERYPGRILAAITLILLQAALIAVLLIQIRRRRKAEQLQLASQETSRRQRDELARVNRVATVGELSTSIAHEVNQPLSAIVSNAQAAIRLLQQTPPDTDEVAAALKDIAGDGNRAAGILNHVRSLAKKEHPTRELVDLNEIVQDVLELVAPDSISRGITIKQDLDNGLPRVEGDKVGLQQLILNLLINAAQAMTGTPPDAKQVTVRTSVEGGSVTLRVCDQGIGLDDESLQQVFHPFFTTRTGGIGMGLSISQSIVESHQGRIWVTQNPTRGVTFHVQLPGVCNTTD